MKEHIPAILSLLKVILILGTAWYCLIFVLPNFYSKPSENKELEQEVKSLKESNSFLLGKAQEIENNMKIREKERENIKESTKKNLKKYQELRTDEEKDDEFNRLLRDRKEKIK